jgi:hypothetical protein
MIILLLLGFIFGSLGWLFCGQIHGIAGAMIIGLNLLAVDFSVQMLRLRFLKKVAAGGILIGILGGFAFRIVSVIIFLRFGAWWLGFESIHFYILLFFLLFLPIINLIEARHFKVETGKTDGNKSR